MEGKKIGYKSESFEEIRLEDYENNWVLIERRVGNPVAGFLNPIVNRKEVILKPYQDFSYGNSGEGKYFINDNDLGHLVEMIDILGCKVKSRQEVQNFCNYMNREAKLDNLKKEKELYELTKIKEHIDSERKIIK